MSIDESRILAALIRAKVEIARDRGDHRPCWTGVVCPSCGTDYRSVSEMDGVGRSNPYHVPSGEHGGQFTSGPGGARLKALAQFKKSKRSEAGEIRREHRREWKETLHKQRIERNKLRREQKRERSSLVKAARKKLADPKMFANVRERNRHRRETKEAIQDLADQHRAERQTLLHDQKGDRETVKAYHKETWESFKFGLGVDAASKGFKKKSRSSPDSVSRKLVIGPGRTTKASSAESILRYCLRLTGLTVAWRCGELTIDQHLMLLEEVRQYGRAWLRHEASEFIKPFAARSEIQQGVRRATSWLAGPASFGSPQNSGFRHSLGRFFRRSKNFVRELILSATLATSGPAPLTGNELAGADQEAQKQEEFFDRFHQDVLTDDPPTPAEFVARAEKYADSAWQGEQRTNREEAIRQGRFRLERRVLGDPKTEHCTDCPPLAAVGWQPIGTLPFIGDSACGPLCLCHFRYAEGRNQPEYFQGKAGPLRAPSEVSILDDTGEVEMIAEPPGGLGGVQIIAGPP